MLLKLNIDIIRIDNTTIIPYIDNNDIIIDAILGIGLNRPTKGFVKKLINHINLSNSFTISIDTPSGMPSNITFELDSKAIVKADLTLTFECPKLSFLLPNSGKFTGQFKLLPIGLNRSCIDDDDICDYYIDYHFIKKIIKKRTKYSYKGDYGHSLIIAGSLGKIGAAILCAKSCFKSGVGLVTVQIPKCGYEIIQTSIPEAMVKIDAGENYLESNLNYEKFSSICIGPGVGQDNKTAKLLRNLLDSYNHPLVIDADALNILSKNKSLIKNISKYSILTPHIGEFKRLVGEWASDEERQKKLRSFSKENNLFVILKGPHSSISCPNGNIIYNSTGNNGMATAGSGDVLTGIITSFLSQGYNPMESAILGTYYHGLSGDIAKTNLGELSLNASDLIEFLPLAYNSNKDFIYDR